MGHRHHETAERRGFGSETHSHNSIQSRSTWIIRWVWEIKSKIKCSTLIEETLNINRLTTHTGLPQGSLYRGWHRNLEDLTLTPWWSRRAQKWCFKKTILRCILHKKERQLIIVVYQFSEENLKSLIIINSQDLKTVSKSMRLKLFKIRCKMLWKTSAYSIPIIFSWT